MAVRRATGRSAITTLVRRFQRLAFRCRLSFGAPLILRPSAEGSPIAVLAAQGVLISVHPPSGGVTGL